MKGGGNHTEIRIGFCHSGFFAPAETMNPRRRVGNSRGSRSSRAGSPSRCGARLMAVLVCGFIMTGCASRPVVGPRTQVQSAALKERLLQLDRRVDVDEATRLANVAVEHSVALAHQFRAVRPAWVGNVLVNWGLRDRGLCYDWANALYPPLHALGLRSLDLHLAVARMDTRHEHNCIVVTAHQQPFVDGVVLDAWRHSGRLWFGDVKTDKYPWQPLPRDRVPPELKKLLDD